MSREVTITEPVQGECDDAQGGPDPQPPTGFVVQPGTYSVDDLDDDRMFLVVDEVPDVCVIVTRTALGLVECIACDGRGEYSYRVAVDEIDTDECEDCHGLGSVTPEVATRLTDEWERTMRESMRHG